MKYLTSKVSNGEINAKNKNVVLLKATCYVLNWETYEF